jgi:hypothetical protein
VDFSYIFLLSSKSKNIKNIIKMYLGNFPHVSLCKDKNHFFSSFFIGKILSVSKEERNES